MREVTPPLPQYAFMAWCSLQKTQGQLYRLHSACHVVMYGANARKPTLPVTFSKHVNRERHQTLHREPWDTYIQGIWAGKKWV